MNPNCCHFIPQFLLVKAASWFEESIPLVVCWSEIVSLLAIVAVRKAIQLVFCAFELKNPPAPTDSLNEWPTVSYRSKIANGMPTMALSLFPNYIQRIREFKVEICNRMLLAKGLPKPTHMLFEIWNQGRLNTTAFDGWLSKHIQTFFHILMMGWSTIQTKVSPSYQLSISKQLIALRGSILVADCHYLSLLEVPFNQPIGYWATQVQDHPCAVSSSWSKTSKRAVGWSSSLPIITFHDHPKAFPA